MSGTSEASPPISAPGLPPVEALMELGGVAHVTELDDVTGRRALRRAVADGHVARLSRGWYGLPGAARAEAAAARLAGHVSHLSAAGYWLWQVKVPPDRPQVCVPRGRKVPRARREGVELRWRDLAHEDVRGRVTSPLRTVLDCARDLPFDEAVVIADSALRRRSIAGDELERAAALATGPGARGVRRVAALADGRADNPFESVLRVLAVEAGLDVEPQQSVDLAAFTAHPDLLDRGRSLALEADSWTHHAERSAFGRDLERYNAFVLAGYRVLRFTREQVFERPEQVRATLAQAATRW